MGRDGGTMNLKVAVIQATDFQAADTEIKANPGLYEFQGFNIKLSASGVEPATHYIMGVETAALQPLLGISPTCKFYVIKAGELRGLLETLGLTIISSPQTP